ncbi:TPA: hypothetical protein ACRXYA_002373, partial [Klebsiella pneumoniae]|uniref:hypothetical protein n=1 Tax=Klebsiella pneumoniae TaxID=573 RepID=UPI002657BB47
PPGNLSAPYPPFRRVAAAPYPAYGVYRRSSLPRPGKRCAAGQSIGAVPAISLGGGCALPGLGVRAACHSFTHLRD